MLGRTAAIAFLALTVQGAEEATDHSGTLAVSGCYHGCFDTWYEKDAIEGSTDGDVSVNAWCAGALETQFVIERCAEHCEVVEAAHDTTESDVRTRFRAALSARRTLLENAGLLPVPATASRDSACDSAWRYPADTDGWGETDAYNGFEEELRLTAVRSDPDFQ